jgi:hypothetical protein
MKGMNSMQSINGLVVALFVGLSFLAVWLPERKKEVKIKSNIRRD